jgi:hypothetical protein
MGRQLLRSNGAAPKVGATTVGVCMAMAMAVSTKVAAAFSTTGSTAAISPYPVQNRRSAPLPFHFSKSNSNPRNMNYFQSTLSSHRSSQRLFATTKNSDEALARSEDCGCNAPPTAGGGDKDLLETGNGPIRTLLGETVLTNIEGNPVKLGNYISDGENDATIVVFLRHLA